MSPLPALAAGEAELRLPVFGTSARILVGAPVADEALSPDVAARLVQSAFDSMHTALTRFSPTRELARLNASSNESVEVSPLMARAVGAAIFAAQRSNGLVDPTVLGALEAAGYRASRRDAIPESIIEALASAPPRRAATPNADRLWAQIEIEPARLVRRPAGLRLDLGGSAKGLAVDIAASRLADYASFAVDAGGDIRLGGDVGPDPHPRHASLVPAGR